MDYDDINDINDIDDPSGDEDNENKDYNNDYINRCIFNILSDYIKNNDLSLGEKITMEAVREFINGGES